MKLATFNPSAVALVTIILVGLGNAQMPSGKRTQDPLKSATKPLTPKSAIPSRKPSAAAGPSIKTRSTNEELNRVEQQRVIVPSSSSSSSRKAHVPPPKPAPAAGSGINATYQKPQIPHK